MSTTEENTTLPTQVPMLDPTVGFSAWKKAILNRMMNVTPNAFKHIISGKKPLFKYPELDIHTRIARKQITQDDVAVNTSLSTADRTLPIQAWIPPSLDYDSEDTHFYYRQSRHPDYAGPSGLSIHALDFKDNGIRKSKFLNEERPAAWSLIERYLGPRVEAQVKIPTEEYDLHLAEIDYMWLWNKVKFVHTGEGAHSNFLIIAKLISNKMLNNNYIPYHDEYWRARTELLERTVNPQSLVDNFLDALFTINMMDPTNTIWSRQIEEELMKETWSTAAEMTKKMQIALKTKEGVEAYTSGGVVQADVANAQRKKKFNVTRGVLEKKTATIYGTRCLRCGKEGCRANTCKTVLAPGEERCSECGEAHHSSMHPLVTKVKQARKAGKLKQNSSRQSSYSPDQRRAEDKKAYAAILTDEKALDDFDQQVEHLEANATILDEYSDIDDEEEDEAVECNDTDIICMEGYSSNLINLTTGKELTVEEFDRHDLPGLVLDDESDDEESRQIKCNHLSVITADNAGVDNIPPIEGPIDSACNGHLIDKKHLNHPDITNRKPCKGVGVQGVDKKAPPIPVLWTATHAVIGTVFIGDYGKNLISVSRLFSDGWSMEGDHNHLHLRKRGKLMFTGYRDHNNMFVANISKRQISANTSDITAEDNEANSESSDDLRDWDDNDDRHESYIAETTDNSHNNM